MTYMKDIGDCCDVAKQNNGAIVRAVPHEDLHSCVFCDSARITMRLHGIATFTTAVRGYARLSFLLCYHTVLNFVTTSVAPKKKQFMHSTCFLACKTGRSFVTNANNFPFFYIYLCSFREWCILLAYSHCFSLAMLSASQHPTPLVSQLQATPAQGGSYSDEGTYNAGTAQLSYPHTPLLLIPPQVPTDVTRQPDTPRLSKRFKRLKPMDVSEEITSPQYSDGTSICDRQMAFLQSDGDTSAKCSVDENERTPSLHKHEQRTLLMTLSRTLNSLTENAVQSPLPLIQQEQMLLFRALRNSLDALSVSLSQQHPDTWTRSIDAALLNQCLADLLGWYERHHITCVPSQYLRGGVPRGFAGRLAVRSSGHRSSYNLHPKVLHSITPTCSGNYLRLHLNTTKLVFNMSAICKEHPGTGCTINRCCRNSRPIGFLWWWLGQGHGRTSTEHKALAHGKGPTYAQRCAARQSFECIAGVEDFLVAEEGGVGQGEPLISSGDNWRGTSMLLGDVDATDTNE